MSPLFKRFLSCALVVMLAGNGCLVYSSGVQTAKETDSIVASIVVYGISVLAAWGSWSAALLTFVQDFLPRPQDPPPKIHIWEER